MAKNINQKKGVTIKRGGDVGDFIKGDVKPERYEKPGDRPKPSTPPPKKKK